METLEQLYRKHKKGDWPDKGSVHSYIEVYEKLLAPYRNGDMLEIGLWTGESLTMWADYFNGNVYGIDCECSSKLFDLIGKYNVCIGDATNPTDIEKYFYGKKFDVIIEDANHDIEQQLNIFVTLKPYLNEGGIYIVEDIQDIDKHSYIFKFNPGWEVLDRRHIKNRYDDVLAIYRK